MSKPPPIVVRHMGFDFQDLPRYWLAGDPFATLGTRWWRRHDAGRFAFSLLPSIVDFLRPGFHPDDQDNYRLAEEYLAAVGRLDH